MKNTKVSNAIYALVSFAAGLFLVFGVKQCGNKTPEPEEPVTENVTPPKQQVKDVSGNKEEPTVTPVKQVTEITENKPAKEAPVADNSMPVLDLKDVKVSRDSEGNYTISGIRVKEGLSSSVKYRLYDYHLKNIYYSDNGSFEGVKPVDSGEYYVRAQNTPSGKESKFGVIKGLGFVVDRLSKEKLQELFQTIDYDKFAANYKDFFVNYDNFKLESNLPDVNTLPDVFLKVDMKDAQVEINKIQYEESGRISYLYLSLTIK